MASADKYMKEKERQTHLRLNQEFKENKERENKIENQQENHSLLTKDSSTTDRIKRSLVVKTRNNVEKWFSQRWIFFYVSHIAMIFVMVVRVGMSVAIVCMVKQTEPNTNRTIDPSCSLRIKNLNETHHGEFEWSELFVANVLAGYFYGYVLTNLLGGFLADKYGGRRVFGHSLLYSGIVLLIYPVLTRVSGYWTLALRIISGLLSGPFFPAMQSLCSRWTPPLERGRLLSITYSGPMTGTIITMSFSGYLCANGFDNGWGSVFYLSGLSVIIFSLIWFYVVYDNPQVHPRISAKELDYLEKTIQCKPRIKYVPWMSILTAKVVWAIVVCHFCYNWSMYMLQIVLPLYMKDVLYFDIKSNGFLSAIPYFGQFISYCFVGMLSDFIIRRSYLSVRGSRVLFQCLGFIGSASFFIATGFVTCNHAMMAVGFLFLAGVFIGFSGAGINVIHGDIAPSYCGMLYGISNGLSSTSGFLAPVITGLLTPNGTREEWQIVFLLCGLLSTFGALVFALFAKGEVQEWARCPQNEDGDNQ